MWYQKKKLWVALVTAIASGVSYYAGSEEIGNAVMVIGLAVIGSLGLEDFGKAAKAKK